MFWSRKSKMKDELRRDRKGEALTRDQDTRNNTSRAREKIIPEFAKLGMILF